jgi:hypothetical protein
MGVGGTPGPVRRSARQYVSGLGAATLGACAAGWLALAPVAFGYRDGAPGPDRAAPHGAARGRTGPHCTGPHWRTGAPRPRSRWYHWPRWRPGS